MSENREILRQILVRAKAAREEARPSLAVFDLDSTLFDVLPRIQRVIDDFARDPAMRARFPESVEILKNAKTERADWGLKDAVVRAGLASHSEEFHRALKDFWLRTFFSNAYLEHDVPYDGAVHYVEALWRAGVEIAYLTGRDVARMGTGTVDVLRKWKFPLDRERTALVLKPAQGMDDAEFKRDWFAALPRDRYAHVWFFENEPVNITALRAHLPTIEVIFFDSTHSGKGEAPTDLPRIMHFLFEEES